MANEGGVPLHAIMQHGRWRSHVVLTYVNETVRVHPGGRSAQCAWRWSSPGESCDRVQGLT